MADCPGLGILELCDEDLTARIQYLRDDWAMSKLRAQEKKERKPNRKALDSGKPKVTRARKSKEDKAIAQVLALIAKGVGSGKA